jgi:hypothetical protein
VILAMGAIGDFGEFLGVGCQWCDFTLQVVLAQGLKWELLNVD